MAASGAKRRRPAGATGGPSTKASGINAWQDDPGDTLPPTAPPELRPVPDLSIAPLRMRIAVSRAPAPAAYEPGTHEFRYWSAAEALARGAAFWRQFLPEKTTWQPGEELRVLLDEGVDFNAFYDRRALNFFHGTAGGRTVFSGESPDVACHEQGHAVLDALRPELFDAGSIEAAAFHEAFGDISAMLAGLQLPSFRVAVLSETQGDLSRSSRLSRLAEQLGWAIRQMRRDAVDPDCLRNAVNSFFYHTPEDLPTRGPAAALSSEPHSFSRVFSGAFLEALAGGFRQTARAPTEADLQKVSLDFARLLSTAVRAAPVVPEYFSQIAAALIVADAADGGKYRDALSSAFVRRGILSTHAAVGMTAARTAMALPAARGAALEAAPPRELPHLALAGAEYGLGDVPLLVRAASEPRRLATAAAAIGVGAVSASSSERAARAFVEDLIQRGHIDAGEHGEIPGWIVHPHTFKTHRLVRTEGGFVLNRILFDCGFHAHMVG
jgi:hypothetical protein